jgi:hypothetical protein
MQQCKTELLMADQAMLKSRKDTIKVTGHPFCGTSLMHAQNQSDFHQIFTKCSPVHAKYGKVVKLANNKIM